ncbi:carboxymuconolactone decarboxylase family protein [Pseudooceanicola sp.]|uniref:carboxymuconolactone decarboxylase family protein n=1 Tax=Pseudooceanicola sp. TaxID=1914328 RepID=UPI003514A393
MSRLPPLDPKNMSGDQAEVYNSIASGARGAVRGPFTVLLHSPELARRTEQMGVYLRFQCAVPERQRELAICIVAAHWRADYEWYAHADRAWKNGVSAQVLEAISSRKMPEFDDPADEAVHAYATELLREGRVSDKVYALAVDAFGASGALDLTGLLGYYTLLALTLNAFEVDIPEDAEIPWASGTAPA